MNTLTKCLLRLPLFLSIVVFACFLSACDGSAPAKAASGADNAASASTATAGDKATEVSSVDLSKKYGDNEVSADEAYKGKKLQITGTVEEISKDALDAIYVVLRGKDEFSSVQVYVDDAKAAAQLKKGQKLTVTGECDGMILGSPIIKDAVIQ